MSDKLEQLFIKIRARHNDARSTSVRESIEAHLQALASDAPREPQNVVVPPFPEVVQVAFATCTCGAREFIVEGSTQECQSCGSLLYRHASETYEKR